MPAYIVQMDDDAAASTKIEGADSIIVFADDVTDAREMARAHFKGDSDSAWINAATVTEIVTAPNASQLKASVRIEGGVSVHAIVRETAELGLADSMEGVTIDGGGTGYSVNDILTLVGGTAIRSRPCRLRVTSDSGGVIDGIEIIDPGMYVVADTPGLSAVAVTDSGNQDATFDFNTDPTSTLDTLAALVMELLAVAVPTIEYDESGASGILTILAGDNMGDADIVFDIKINDVPITGLVSTVSGTGAQASARTITFPADSAGIPQSIAAARLKF